MSRSYSEIQELASGKIGRLLLKYSWPALVAMTLNALYSVVDRAFIGWCGVDSMAGLQIAMPVMMLLTSFGPLVGVGHAAVLSIKLGEGDRVSCEKLVGQTIALKIGFYAILVPLLFIYIDPLLSLCGADKVTAGARSAAKSYLEIVLFSHIFSHLAFGLSALQRAEGGALRSMICMVVGFGTNILLDPLFIFVFNMGIEGAAWATNIAMFTSCLCAFSYYWFGKSVIRLRLRRIWIYPKLLLRTLSIGLAPFLQQFMSALIAASLQIAFTKWMPDEASRTDEIASLGVFTAALILVFMPILGCQQGLQPIFGYNWGARNFRRVLETLKIGFVATTVLTVIAFVIQVVPPFPTWCARLFVNSGGDELIALCARDLALANCMIWTISINVLATTYFQSIGKPGVAIFLSMLRQGLVLMPIIWFLPYFMDDKPLAIWLSIPISDVICQIATIPPLLLHARFLSKVRDRTVEGEFTQK